MTYNKLLKTFRADLLVALVILCVFTIILSYNVYRMNLSERETLGEDDICRVKTWRQFKANYSKNYDHNPAEDLARASQFCKNLKDIKRHNSNRETMYTLGININSDTLPKEYAHLPDLIENERFSYEPEWDSSREELKLWGQLSQMIDINKEPPLEVDWSRDPKRVSRARNQGLCGSCWAFALVAFLEGQEKPSGNSSLVELSEQNIIDCDTVNKGCSGGQIQLASEQMSSYGGLMSRADYPYESDKSLRAGPCRVNRSRVEKSTRNLAELVRLKPGNDTLLMQVVANYGPLVSYLQVKSDFLHYKDGVYFNPPCSSTPNHVVLIVGYGQHLETGLKYWKIKNSWSESWGQKGFAKIKRKNHCNLTAHVYFMPPK